MPWFFRTPESVEPAYIMTTEPAQNEQASSDCAWCGTGEGICEMHTALLFAQSTERKEKRSQSR